MKDVLSQTPTVPQFHTASLRSDRTQLATQRAYKPSDSGAFAHSSRTPVDNLEESLTQSLPADFCYRTHSQRLTADQKGIKNEVFVESYSKQTSVESGRIRVHRKAAEELNQMQGSSESSALLGTENIELQPYSTPAATVEPQLHSDPATAVESQPHVGPGTTVELQLHSDPATAVESQPHSGPGTTVELQLHSDPATAQSHSGPGTTVEPQLHSDPATAVESQPHSGPGTTVELQLHSDPATAVESQPHSHPATTTTESQSRSDATIELQPPHSGPTAATVSQPYSAPVTAGEPQLHDEPSSTESHSGPGTAAESQPCSYATIELQHHTGPSTAIESQPYNVPLTAGELQPHSELPATSGESQSHSTPKPTNTAAVTPTVVDPVDKSLTLGVKVQSTGKELPTILEEVSLKMPSPSSQAGVGDLFSPTSASIVSSQLLPTSPQLSPVPPTADEIPQENIRDISQRKTVKDWMVVTLSDITICEGEEEQIRYRRYCWHLFTIAIFYALPAFQLILTYQQLLNTTGNQDICYYNYLCSHKLGEVR